MKRHLNTLFVTTQDTWLSKEGECVEIRLDRKSLGKIPLHTLQSIVCFGHVSCSQYLLEHCAKRGVSVTWFTEYGRFMASMQGPVTGNVLLRRTQYRLADSEQASADLARFFIIGKIANCRTVLLRQARAVEEPSLGEAAKKCVQSCRDCPFRIQWTPYGVWRERQPVSILMSFHDLSRKNFEPPCVLKEEAAGLLKTR